VRLDAIRLLREEWVSVGRSAGAADAVSALASRDPSVAALAARCLDGEALLAYMHPGPGCASRNESAALVSVMLDLLSAIRGRLRRMLYKHRDHGAMQLELFHDRGGPSSWSVETDLEILARSLEAADYLSPRQADVLYATAVLGLPATELSRETGVPVGTLRRARRSAVRAMVAAQ
jgi:hypothetical protein